MGVSKAGIKGIAALIVTGFALAFGAKASTGILMPLLLLGDIFAVSYYKGFVKWNYIIKLLPWMILGVLIGVIGGGLISEIIFKYSMAGIILFSVGQMYYWENRKEKKFQVIGVLLVQWEFLPDLQQWLEIWLGLFQIFIF